MSTIWFDLDGTLYDLYNQPSWLEMLDNEKSEVYSHGNSLVDVSEFSLIVTELKKQGYKFGVITWLSRDCSRKFGDAIRYQKRKWLNKTFPNLFDVVHIVKYGTDKSKFITSSSDVLFDDDVTVCHQWCNKAIAINLIHKATTEKERKDNERDILGALKNVLAYGSTIGVLFENS